MTLPMILAPLFVQVGAVGTHAYTYLTPNDYAYLLNLVRPKVVETTALGAAYLAGLAVGFWKSRQEVHSAWKVDRTFSPSRSVDEVAHRRSRWAEALKRARDWEERTEFKVSPSLH